MLIVDSHLDLGRNALWWERDLTQEGDDHPRAGARPPKPGRAEGTVALPDLRRGRVGAVADIWMLQPGFVRGASNADVLLERICDHVDHVCQLAGDARHAGIGSDLDGGYGRSQSPADLDTVADLQRLGGLLRGRGYTDEDVSSILHENWFRCLERVLVGPEAGD